VTKRLAMLAIAAMLAAAAPAFAHEHKIMGTVKTAAADHLIMKTTDGKDVTIKIDHATQVRRDKAPIKPESLASGTRVVVTTASDESPYAAIAIQAGPVPSDSARKK
jgi:hypothetical protein